MSSAEATMGVDARNKPAFPLPPELRVKIYEQLLVHPSRSLRPNGFMRYTWYSEHDYIFTSILRTCRNFYEEALPILYGKNTLAFHDNDFSKPVLPFPKGHLSMVKHVEVDISPLIYSSAQKMGQFLMTLGTFGVNIVDLTIRIHMLEHNDEFLRPYHDMLPPLHLLDHYLIGDHPILGGLISLKAVKKLSIEMYDEARFEPGFANALKDTFMMEGTADGRSITIKGACDYPHRELFEEGEPCRRCGITLEDLHIYTAGWEYKDDIRSYLALENFLALGGELKKGKSTKANSQTGIVAKAKKRKTKAAARKFTRTRTTKQTKAKSARPSSKKAA